MLVKPSEFVSDSGAYLSGLPSRICSWPYPKTFGKDVKVCRDKHSSLSFLINKLVLVDPSDFASEIGAYVSGSSI